MIQLTMNNDLRMAEERARKELEIQAKNTNQHQVNSDMNRNLLQKVASLFSFNLDLEKELNSSQTSNLKMKSEIDFLKSIQKNAEKLVQEKQELLKRNQTLKGFEKELSHAQIELGQLRQEKSRIEDLVQKNGARFGVNSAAELFEALSASRLNVCSLQDNLGETHSLLKAEQLKNTDLKEKVFLFYTDGRFRKQIANSASGN
jgi:predicted RNase H-like nuclease (RuvC/YqgF family)